MKHFLSPPKLALLLFSAVSLLSSELANAMSVTPIVLDMQDSGGKAKSVLRVSNDAATAMQVEIKISRLELDENGKSTTVGADRDFVIFPPVATIAPGGSQAFRVQWAGAPRLEKSQGYILSVNQLPVKFPNAQSGMQLLVNFAVVANVDPVGATATIDLVSAGIGRDEAGTARPQLVVQNNGNKHASLADASVTLASGKWTQTLRGPDLRQMLGVALIQPRKRRKFTIPVPLPAGTTALTARIDYQPLATSSVSK
jgi:P pilus assembly chaperone PapD